MTESEKGKKKAEVTIFTTKCNAAIDVAKELEALRIKAERKHREAEKQYEAKGLDYGAYTRSLKAT